MPRFLVIDDHPLFREALEAAIRSAYPAAEVTEATQVGQALALVAAEPAGFDLALLDLSMPGTQGFDGLLQFRAQFPRLPVMIVSGLEDPRIVREALSYGAAGFAPKSSNRAELTRAVTEVMNGNVYAPSEFVAGGPAAPQSPKAPVDLPSRLKSLTPAQLRVLQMLRQGLLNKQIAHELDVSETTVKAHVSEILRKLGVFSRTQAVIEASKIDFSQITGLEDRN